MGRLKIRTVGLSLFDVFNRIFGVKRGGRNILKQKQQRIHWVINRNLVWEDVP